jgi:hypothetical protein
MNAYERLLKQRVAEGVRVQQMRKLRMTNELVKKDLIRRDLRED